MLLVTAFTVVTCVTCALIRLRSRPRDYFDPAILFAVYVIIGYVFPQRTFLAGDDVFIRVWPYEFSDFDRSVRAAQAVVFAAVVAFYSGYFLVLNVSRRKPSRPYYWLVARTNTIVASYTVLGVGLFGVGVSAVGGLGVLLENLGDRIRLFAGLNYYFMGLHLVLAAALLRWLQHLTTPSRRVPVFRMVTSAVAVLFLGNRATFFVFGLSCLVCYNLLRRRVGGIQIVAGVAVGLVVLAALNIVLREYLTVGEIVTVAMFEPRTWFESVNREVAVNFMQFQILTVIADAMPEVLPTQFGRTLFATLVIAVPSAVWPTKPLTAAGVLTDHIWPARWSQLGTTLPPGLVGELYMNFHFAGVFVGMLVFGGLYARLKTGAEFLGVWEVAAYAVMLAAMGHFMRGETAGPTVLVLSLLIPARMAISACLIRPNRRGRACVYGRPTAAGISAGTPVGPAPAAQISVSSTTALGS